MPRFWLVAVAAALSACGHADKPVAVQSATAPTASAPVAPDAQKKSGIPLDNIDQEVRPQDDFFRYVNGAWLDKTEIPPDEVRYGSWVEVRERNEARLKVVLEEAALADAEIGSDEQKIGDFYTSYMDEARVNELGLAPLEDELALIEAAESYGDLARLFGRNMWLQLGAPFDYYVDRDRKDTSRYLFYLWQGGLGMPDRDYYLKDDEKFAAMRAGYVDYADRILSLAGHVDSRAQAEAILALETRMAEIQWDKVRTRDRIATYNPMLTGELAEVAPGFEWKTYLDAAGLGSAADINLSTPSFFTDFAKLLPEVPMDQWKAYLTLHLIDGYAYQLSQPFFDARFEFRGRVLRGQEAPRERWEYALQNANVMLRDAIGRIYLERFFPPEAGERMNEMVANLRAAYSRSIDELDWMQPQTKAEAQKKLAALQVYVGYPAYWRNYKDVEIIAGDLIGNMLRGTRQTYENDIGDLSKPPRKGEFLRGTQEVNAYYLPTAGELVFLAGVLQPPFFDLEADEAINYGAIGAAIGHEMLHAFDDQGRKIDEKGELRDWWAPEDAEEYERRTQKIIEQYNAFEPIEGLHVNGELTVGENIGDLAGLTMAYRAYELSLDGKPAPVIDGFTGEQRFFLGFGGVWRMKAREDFVREQVLSDPHSPEEYRVTGVVSNMPEFYEAFDVKEGDGLWRSAEDRVEIW
jgi:putative endopeptidase